MGRPTETLIELSGVPADGDPPVYALFEKCAAAVSFGRRGAATMPIYTKVYFTTVGQSDKVYKILPKLIHINFPS